MKSRQKKRTGGRSGDAADVTLGVDDKEVRIATIGALVALDTINRPDQFATLFARHNCNVMLYCLYCFSSFFVLVTNSNEANSRKNGKTQKITVTRNRRKTKRRMRKNNKRRTYRRR